MVSAPWVTCPPLAGTRTSLTLRVAPQVCEPRAPVLSSSYLGNAQLVLACHVLLEYCYPTDAAQVMRPAVHIRVTLGFSSRKGKHTFITGQPQFRVRYHQTRVIHPMPKTFLSSGAEQVEGVSGLPEDVCIQE